MLNKIIPLFLLPSLLCACGGGTGSPPTPVVPPAPVVQVQPSFRKLVEFNGISALNGPAMAQNLVIRSETEWAAALKDTRNATFSSRANFNTETVLMVAIGMKPVINLVVSFLSVEPLGEKLVATVEVGKCGGIGGDVISYPAAAVAIPITTKEVVFNITEPTKPTFCTPI